MTMRFPPQDRRSRGMRDLLPPGMRAFRRVEDAFRSASSRWGYEEIRTPTIENYSLFTASGTLTPQMLSRVYSFLDWDGWSGERVVLRPDSTIPVSRAAAEAGLLPPSRLFYVQNVFRFHESDDREEWQCGIEYLGAPPLLGDLEVVAVGCETLEGLGLHPLVRIGHVGVSRAVVHAISNSEQDRRALLDRVTQSGLRALQESAAHLPGLATFVEAAVLESPGVGLVHNLQGLATGVLPAVLPALQEAAGVAGALAATGRRVVLDFGMARDFEYYTGVVFELDTEHASWGRGGRYAPQGASATTEACGLGLSLDQLAAHAGPSTRRRQSVSIVPVDPQDLTLAMAAARALHRGGIAAALATARDAGELSLRIEGTKLTAHTPDGDIHVKSLDEVVGILVQYK
ncbi:MAG: ATP phosphoribosyltransferase regulatory subunit [Dehalococcoidia bacterium]|nr:ATP phosphoribosyltransferase regulatory subunit [Dehalococcoidia bacterium]MCA9831657.1 ATP phosphoribosyltransferase regulatory subunit [Dehalococcoidia bacterium]MCB9484701.1 ATP phosphoribosyltransferase regulatory subunit [Thermoflexaceae bacterium]